MSHDGTCLCYEVALYATVGLVCLVPVAAVAELLAAAFSKRVRQYIRRHPVAHAVWFVCALFLVLLLIPTLSHPPQTRKNVLGMLTPSHSIQRMGASRIVSS